MGTQHANLSGVARHVSLDNGSTESADILITEVFDAPSLFSAWCILLHRISDQDCVEVQVLLHQEYRWTTRTLPIVFQEGEPAGDFSERASLLFKTAACDALAEQDSLCAGFIFSENGLPTQEELALSDPNQRGMLRLTCLVCEDGIQCSLAGGEDRNQQALLTQILGQYRVLLTSLKKYPGLQLRALPMLTPDERHSLLAEWSGPKIPAPAKLIHKQIEFHATERPDAVAIRLGSSGMTYKELNQSANRLAHWLVLQGVVSGSRVAVCMEPCFDFLICMLAIFKAGATHVPLDPNYPEERLTTIIQDVNPSILIADECSLEKVRVLNLSSVSLREIERELITLSVEDLNKDVKPEQIAYIVYTSGTTGKPKGVMASHANLAHYIGVGRGAFGYSSTDIVPAVARFTFSITFFELLSPLAAGGCLVLLERNHVLDMSRMVDTLATSTCIHCSPSLWRKIINFIDDQKINIKTFDNMRHVSSGGDMVPPDVLEALKRLFRNAEVFVIYGCSEVSCMGCFYPVPRNRVIGSTRVGRPFPNMTLRLLDNQGELVPPGVIGEVCFGGTGIAVGYLNQPELTGEKFANFGSERLYRTGDLGRVDSDGNLELIGRSDFQIKLRGIRIEPAEIEANLRAAPGVKDAVVAAPTLRDGEKRLTAFVVPDSNAPATPQQLRRFLKQRLPDYMIPASFMLMDALPVNINQKVDRLTLSRITELPANTTVTSDPPRNDLERQLVEIWEAVLQVKNIGVRDDFWEIGGDSLRSVALMTAIDKKVGIALPVSALFTNPTIEQLALLCSTDTDHTVASIVCLKRGSDNRPAVFFVHDGAGESMPYLNLAMRLHPDHSVYGIHPKSSRHHPILHTRLSEMVDHYISLIKSVQPQGPYLVGGLCIGGFLAFEIGRKLSEMGEQVGPVALIDVAHVTIRPLGLSAKRINRFSSEIKKALDNPKLHQRLINLTKIISGRIYSVLSYEIRSRYNKRKTKLKMKLFRFFLDRGLPLPAFLRDISVDAALRFAEKEYVVPSPYQGEAILLRATSRDPALEGIVNDTPYKELFADPMLGWEGKVSELATYDIPAGHSSMLREPHVEQVANILQRHINTALQVP
jgi:amino acid adenylation domain